MAVLTIADDEAMLAATAADRATALLAQAIAARGNATFCLTGGQTPRRLYGLLGDPNGEWQRRVDWAHVHLFWGDERHVPPDHPDSNFGMAHEMLIVRAAIPTSHVHRVRGELPDALGAANEYERSLRHGFELAHRTSPSFDVMLLGMGDDAHIASIFPNSPLLAGWRIAGDGRPRLVTESTEGQPFAETRRVAAVRGPDSKGWRITLTPPSLLDANAILVLVAGDRKASAVRAALELPMDVERWPAQLLRAAGDRVEWLMDRGAASALGSVTG